ncbi:hypothetical protein GCM10020254_57030 [Streptomyces goshikiensis]
MDPAAVGRGPAGQRGEVVVVTDAQGEADPAEFEAAVGVTGGEDALLVPEEVPFRVRGHMRPVRPVDQSRDGGARAPGAQGDVHRGGDAGRAERVETGVVGVGDPQAGVGRQRLQLVPGERELGEHDQFGALLAGPAGQGGRQRGVRGDVGRDTGQLGCGDLHRLRMPARPPGPSGQGVDVPVRPRAML